MHLLNGDSSNLHLISVSADMGYRCLCNMGFSGAECEINGKSLWFLNEMAC